jgi:hypothetical protein
MDLQGLQALVNYTLAVSESLSCLWRLVTLKSIHPSPDKYLGISKEKGLAWRLMVRLPYGAAPKSTDQEWT